MKSLSKLRKLLVASGGRHAHVIQRSGPSATYYYINSRQTGQVSCCLSFLTAVEEARSLSAAIDQMGGGNDVSSCRKTETNMDANMECRWRSWWYTVFHYSSPLAVAAMYCRLCTSSRSLCSQVTRRREPSKPPRGGAPVNFAIVGSGPAGFYTAQQLLKVSTTVGATSIIQHWSTVSKTKRWKMTLKLIFLVH